MNEQTIELDNHDHEGHFDAWHPWMIPLWVAGITSLGLIIVALIKRYKKPRRKK